MLFCEQTGGLVYPVRSVHTLRDVYHRAFCIVLGRGVWWVRYSARVILHCVLLILPLYYIYILNSIDLSSLVIVLYYFYSILNLLLVF